MNDAISMSVKDCCKVGERIYFVSSDMNLVFSINMESDNLDIIGTIPSRSFVENELFGAISILKNKIVLAPYQEPDIWVYDLKNGNWTLVPKKYIQHMGTGGVLQIVNYGQLVFLIGASYPAIIKLDTETLEVQYIEKPFIDKQEKVKKVNDAFFRSHFVVKNEWLYLASCIDNTVLKFNLQTDDYSWVSIGNYNYRFSGIATDGKNFWLSPRTNETIIKWDGMEKIKEIQLPDIYKEKFNYFLGICYDGKKILLPNMLECKSIEINPIDDTINILPEQYMLMKQVNQNEIVSVLYNGELRYIKNNQIIYNRMLSVEREKIEKFCRKKGKELYTLGNVYNEGNLYTLNNFIDYIERTL